MEHITQHRKPSLYFRPKAGDTRPQAVIYIREREAGNSPDVSEQYVACLAAAHRHGYAISRTPRFYDTEEIAVEGKAITYPGVYCDRCRDNVALANRPGWRRLQKNLKSQHLVRPQLVVVHDLAKLGSRNGHAVVRELIALDSYGVKVLEATQDRMLDLNDIGNMLALVMI